MRLSRVTSNGCNPGIEFLILESRIKKIVIPRSHFGIRLTEENDSQHKQILEKKFRSGGCGTHVCGNECANECFMSYPLDIHR